MNIRNGIPISFEVGFRSCAIWCWQSDFGILRDNSRSFGILTRGNSRILLSLGNSSIETLMICSDAMRSDNPTKEVIKCCLTNATQIPVSVQPKTKTYESTSQPAQETRIRIVMGISSKNLTGFLRVVFFSWNSSVRETQTSGRFQDYKQHQFRIPLRPPLGITNNPSKCQDRQSDIVSRFLLMYQKLIFHSFKPD